MCGRLMCARGWPQGAEGTHVQGTLSAALQRSAAAQQHMTCACCGAAGGDHETRGRLPVLPHGRAAASDYAVRARAVHSLRNHVLHPLPLDRYPIFSAKFSVRSCFCTRMRAPHKSQLQGAGASLHACTELLNVGHAA